MFTRLFYLRLVIASLVCFSFLLVLFSCGGGSSGKSDESYLSYSLIRDMGQEALEADQQAAISIALMSDGDMLWSQEFGYADQADQTPVTRETRFGIGSVSKVFTAAAIVKLADQGLVVDLIARPIGRKILKPDQPNRAYDIIETKFRRDPKGNVKGWGLKVFP